MSERIMYPFPLGGDRFAYLNFPKDMPLTQADVNRIASFMNTLVVPEEAGPECAQMPVGGVFTVNGTPFAVTDSLGLTQEFSGQDYESAQSDDAVGEASE